LERRSSEQILGGNGVVLGPNDSLDLAALAVGYRSAGLTPTAVVIGILDRIARRGDDKVWIHLLPRDELLAIAKGLEVTDPASKPLFGVPFAIKDNLDLAGHPTTAGCPSYAYTPDKSATVVRRLMEAGAIPIGKTNLDQFAAGLNGTRSPYGAPRSALNAEYISGGSSSGSAVAVASGLVSFSLGSDTAGSGRVPAQFNNVIGMKPTKGLLSTSGLVPACRSLDCVSIFALCSDDARDVLAVAKSFDATDPFSRHEALATFPRQVKGTRFGVPRREDLQFFGNREGERLFDSTLERIVGLGGALVEVDLRPFLETARLLYEGPWVAERYVAIREFIDRNPEALFPVTRQIIAGGAKPLAADAFVAYYRLKELQRITDAAWREIDAMITPTAPRPYTVAELLDDPIRLNSNLGYYTNFVNLLDLAGVAFPGGFQRDGLPFGVTLLARAFTDAGLLELSDEIHRALDFPLGALDTRIPAKRKRPAASAVAAVRVAVCGAHMAGLPLNGQLVDRGGRLVRTALTAPRYRLYALPGGPPARPGMIRVEPGKAIEVEVWEMPTSTFGSFVDGVPPPLAIGTVELADGEKVKGFVCEAHGTIDALDITELGGWRRYIAEGQRQSAAS
jgi:allophanate hydrolase